MLNIKRELKELNLPENLSLSQWVEIGGNTWRKDMSLEKGILFQISVGPLTYGRVSGMTQYTKEKVTLKEYALKHIQNREREKREEEEMKKKFVPQFQIGEMDYVFEKGDIFFRNNNEMAIRGWHKATPMEGCYERTFVSSHDKNEKIYQFFDEFMIPEECLNNHIRKLITLLPSVKYVEAVEIKKGKEKGFILNGQIGERGSIIFGKEKIITEDIVPCKGAGYKVEYLNTGGSQLVFFKN